MEEAVFAVSRETVRVVASGRTDAGVHARGQVVSFSLPTRLDANVWRKALNANLPEDIRVLNVEDCDFEAITIDNRAVKAGEIFKINMKFSRIITASNNM